MYTEREKEKERECVVKIFTDKSYRYFGDVVKLTRNGELINLTTLYTLTTRYIYFLTILTTVKKFIKELKIYFNEISRKAKREDS